MKIKIEIDMTPEEAKEMFVPGDKQTEFMQVTYNAYVKALNSMIMDHVDPYNFTTDHRRCVLVSSGCCNERQAVDRNKRFYDRRGCIRKNIRIKYESH